MALAATARRSVRAPAQPARAPSGRPRAKGVDLYRAERDTKIRARYLGALERGEYRELPGAVYTKGFLRNYALYLGLDPDEILVQWRRERGDGGAQSEPSINVPRPLSAPRQGFTFSPGLARRGAHDRRRPAVRRLPRRPAPALLASRRGRGHRSVDRGVDGRGDRDRATRSAAPRCPAPRCRSPWPAASSHPGHGQLRRDVDGGRRPAPGQEPVQRQRHRPRYRQERRRSRSSMFITVPFHVLGADPRRRPARGGRDVRERGDPGPGHRHQRQDRHRQRGYAAPAPSRRRRRDARAAERRPRRPPSTSAADGTFSMPVELTAGNWTITVTAASPEGKTTSLDAQRHGRATRA